METIWPFALYTLLVVLMVAGIIVASHLLGPRHRETATGDVFESGIRPTGSARLRFSAGFYLVAMFFVIFDLESVFIYAWAVSAREAGWLGFWEAAIFIGLLGAALAYLWRLGALDGATPPTRRNGDAATRRST